MLLITSECRIPAGLTRISPSTSSYLLPSLGVFRRSRRVAGPLIVIIVIVRYSPPRRGCAERSEGTDGVVRSERHFAERPPSSTWTATGLSSCHGRLAC